MLVSPSINHPNQVILTPCFCQALCVIYNKLQYRTGAAPRNAFLPVISAHAKVSASELGTVIIPHVLRRSVPGGFHVQREITPKPIPGPELLIVDNQEPRSVAAVNGVTVHEVYDISRLGYSSERRLPDSSQLPEFRSHAAESGGLWRP
jgi:hypothetical protein